MFFKKDSLAEKLTELKAVPDLYEFVQEFGFIAGGAVRDTIRKVPPKDWDIFFRTDAAKDKFIAKFGGKFDVTGIGNYNYKQFQFITLYTGSPQEVVKVFDWNVNMVWFDPKTARIGGLANNDMDLCLNFDCNKPLSALLRLPYMIQKGYKIEQHLYMTALSFLSQRVALNDAASVIKQHEWMSSNGGLAESAANWAVERAKEEAKKRSKLHKVLK